MLRFRWKILCVRLKVEAVGQEKPRRPREKSGVCSQWGVLSKEQAHLQIPENEGLRMMPPSAYRCQVEFGAKEICGSCLGEVAGGSGGLHSPGSPARGGS